jgi:hypothetical protein
MGQILQAAPTRFSVCSYVKDHEALGIFNGQIVNGKRQRTPIDLEPLINTGILDVVVHDLAIHSSHILVLAQAGISGMGEKISAAIALEKNWGIVTDDRHAHKKLTVLMPNCSAVEKLDRIKPGLREYNVLPAPLPQTPPG